MKIYLHNHEIDISAERNAFNHYQQVFWKFKLQSDRVFKRSYSNNRTINDVLSRSGNHFYEAVSPVIAFCVKELIENGCYAIDEAKFIERYLNDFEIWHTAMEHLEEQYQSIITDAREMDAYRVARRKYRGRVIGGGFGVSGAIKGMATAGAMNAASGAGHMLVNGLGKITSSAADSAKKTALFKNQNTRTDLCIAVESTVQACFNGLVNSLYQNTNLVAPYKGKVTQKAADAAAAIIKNAKSTTDSALFLQMMWEAFSYSPYNPNWYLLFYKRFPEDLSDLERIAQHFGVEAFYQELIDAVNDYGKKLSVATEQEALQSKELLRAFAHEKNCLVETTQSTRIQDAIIMYDKEYRTVKDVLLDTRQEADLARKEAVVIDEVLRITDTNSLQSLSVAIEKLSVLETAIVPDYIAKLERTKTKLFDSLRAIDTLLPEVGVVLCENDIVANELKHVPAELYQALMNCKVNDQYDEAALLQFLQSLKEKQVHNIIEDVYLKETEAQLAAIDLKIRTVYGKEYATREEARSASSSYEYFSGLLCCDYVSQKVPDLKEQIKASTLSEQVKSKLYNRVLLSDHPQEVRVLNKFQKISAFVFAAAILACLFVPITVSMAYAEKAHELFGVRLAVGNLLGVEKLGLVDAIFNPLLIICSALVEAVAGFFKNYFAGFHHGFILNVLWIVWGIIWNFCIQFFVLLPVRYVVSVVGMLFQSASVVYYPVYIMVSLYTPCFVLLALVGTKDSNDFIVQYINVVMPENLKKIKRNCIAFLIVAIVWVLFIQDPAATHSRFAAQTDVGVVDSVQTDATIVEPTQSPTVESVAELEAPTEPEAPTNPQTNDTVSDVAVQGTSTTMNVSGQVVMPDDLNGCWVCGGDSIVILPDTGIAIVGGWEYYYTFTSQEDGSAIIDMWADDANGGFFLITNKQTVADDAGTLYLDFYDYEVGIQVFHYRGEYCNGVG